MTHHRTKYLSQLGQEEYGDSWARMAAVKADTLQQTIKNPEDTTKFWATQQAGTSAATSGRSDFDIPQIFANWDNDMKANSVSYSDNIERIWTNSRGTMPLTWMVQQDPEDLKMVLGANEWETQELFRRLAHEADANKYSMQYAARQEAEIEERIKKIQRGKNFAQWFEQFNPLNPLTYAPKENPDNVRNYEDIRAEAVAQLKAEEWKDAQSGPGFWNRVWGGLMVGANAVFNQFEDIGVGVYANFVPEEERVDLPWSWERSERAKEAAVAEVEQRDLAAIAREHTRSSIANDVTSGRFQDENPQLWAEVMESVGGDQVMAMGFIIGEVEDRLKPEDQLELGEQVQRATIEMVEEADYQASARVLDALAWYGRNVPGRIATGLTLWWSDEDFKDLVLQNKWSEWNQMIADENYLPSEALGWHGFGGFGLDMTLTTIFDPTTWIFSPAGKGAFGRPMTAEAASNIARKGAGSAAARSFAENLGNRNLAAAMADMKWMVKNAPHEFFELVSKTRVKYIGGEGAAGQGLNKAITDQLKELSERELGQIATEGASPNVALIRDRLDATEWQSSRVRGLNGKDHEVWINGEKFTVKHHISATRNADEVLDELSVALFDQNGKLRAGGYVTSEGTGGWIAPGFERGSGVFDEIIDYIRISSHTHGETDAARFILQAAKDNSITEAGAGTIRRQAKRLLDNAEGLGAYIRPFMDEEEVATIMERAIMNGAVPAGHRQGAIAAAVGRRVREALNSDDPTSAFRHYFGKYKTTNVMSTKSRTALADIVDHISLIWGDDIVKANEYLGVVMERIEQTADQLLKRANDPRNIEISALAQKIEDNKALIQDPMDFTEEQSFHAQINEQITSDTKRMQTLMMQLTEEYPAMEVNLGGIMQQLYEDFNKNVLAKMPEWQSKVNPQTGMVPWEAMKGGGVRQQHLRAPEFKQMLDDVAEEAGVPTPLEKVEEAMKRVYFAGDNPWEILPMSPLDLIVASTSGGAKKIIYLQNHLFQDWLLKKTTDLNIAWKIDKVLRPATAAVVSIDEMTRIFHLYGVEAMVQYVYDKAAAVASRATAKFQTGEERWAKLSEAQRERLRNLKDLPEQIRAGEALGWDQAGTETVLVEPGQAGYKQAASDFYHYFTSQRGYLEYTKGFNDFEAFWNGPENTMKTAWTPDGPKIVTASEAFDGWRTIEHALLRDVNEKGTIALRAEMHKAAAAAGRGESGRLPDVMFDITPAVRGYKRGGFRGKPNPVSDTFQEMTEAMFSNPMNYRRALLYKMAHKTEAERLVQLYRSQGKRILDDKATKKMLGLPDNVSLATYDPQALDYLLSKSGYVTERTIDSAARAFAEDQLTDLLYAWDMGSQFGRKAKAVFPFGGPWADMWGFWGREMMNKPVLRGQASNNAWHKATGRVGDMLATGPGINLKTGGMISRVAAQDFEREDAMWGVDVDLSPMIFFPTQGENAFGTLLPGMGYIPTFMLDLVLTSQGDPLNDPVGYRELLESVSEFIPAAEYMGEPWFQSLISGGNFRSVIRAAQGFAAGALGDWGMQDTFRDVGMDITLNRHVSVMMAEEMDELLQAETTDDIVDLLNTLVGDAQRRSGAETFAKTAGRWLAPARLQFDQSYEGLQELWVDVSKTSPRLQPKRQYREEDMDDPEILRQYAADVRAKYFELPSDEADLILVNNPSLAVNLVGGWQWSRRGKDKLGQDTTTPYRTGGSDEDQARHEFYLAQGFIEPMDPYERASTILGTIQAAKRRLSRSAYEKTVANINDFMWENVVSDSTKIQMEFYVGEFGEAFNVTDARSLWEAWGGMENDIEFELVSLLGVDPDSEQTKEALSKINVPTKERAWGATLPTDEEAISQKATDLPLGAFMEVFDEYEWPTEIYDEIGLPINSNTTFAQLVTAVYTYRGRDNDLNVEVLDKYNTYIGERGETATNAVNVMKETFKGESFDRAARHRLDKFMLMEQNLAEERSARGFTLRSDLEKVRQEFGNLMVIADEPAFMLSVWKKAYERKYGPWFWEAPEPPELEGNPYAYRPVIREIVDGDTLVVKNGNRNKRIRLLGVRARDYGLDDAGAIEDEEKLRSVLDEAVRQNKPIYLVRDPDQFGSNTDMYGRELAWLYIGDTPWYSEEAFLQTDYR